MRESTNAFPTSLVTSRLMTALEEGNSVLGSGVGDQLVDHVGTDLLVHGHINLKTRRHSPSPNALRLEHSSHSAFQELTIKKYEDSLVGLYAPKRIGPFAFSFSPPSIPVRWIEDAWEKPPVV